MEDLLRAIVVIIAGTGLIAPFMLALRALFPRRIRRSHALADAMPGRSIVIGAVNLLFLGGLALAFSALADAIGNELPRLPAIVIFAALCLALSFGLSVVAQLIGERLWPQADDVRRMLWGAITLTLGSTLPLIGWFALLPYAACLGLGAFILSFFVRERAGSEGQQG
jgi:hypothetical protein